jgi:photosystem II stability/assembly factor-like uncharacterized protein
VNGGRLYTSDDPEREDDWREVPAIQSGRVVDLTDLAFGPRTPGSPAPSTLWASGPFPGVLRSADGGASWTLVAAPRGAALIARLGDGTLLLAGEGVVRSRDGGASWEETLTPTSGLEAGEERIATRLLVGSGSSPTLYLQSTVYHRIPPYLDHEELLRSRDGGATWTLLPGGGEALALDPSRPRSLYRLDAQGLARSDDEGDGWTRLAPPLPPGVASEGLWRDGSSGRFYAATSDGKAHRTRRNGAGWEPAGTGLETIRFLSSLAGDPNLPHLLYTGNFGALFAARFP